jgi:hypothetical protein
VLATKRGKSVDCPSKTAPAVGAEAVHAPDQGWGLWRPSAPYHQFRIVSQFARSDGLIRTVPSSVNEIFQAAAFASPKPVNRIT